MTNFSGLPDTTTPRQGIGRTWHTIRVLALVITPLALGLTLLAPSLRAQDTKDLDCDDFATPTEAQAELDRDATDPNNLDADDDGLACEQGDDDSSKNGGSADDQYSPQDGTDDEAEDRSRAPDDRNGQPLRQTPGTGGPALLPLAGVVLVAWSAIGVSLLRRPN